MRCSRSSGRFNGLPFVQGRSGHRPAYQPSTLSRFNGLPFVQGRSEEPNDGVRGAQVVSMGSPSYRGDQQKVGLDRLGSRGWFQWAPLRTGEIRLALGSGSGSHHPSFNGLPFVQGRSGVIAGPRLLRGRRFNGLPFVQGRSEVSPCIPRLVLANRFQWAPLRTGEIRPGRRRRRRQLSRRFNGLPFVQGRSAGQLRTGSGTQALPRFNGLPFVQGRSGSRNRANVGVVD